MTEITVAIGEHRPGKFVPVPKLTPADEDKQKAVYYKLAMICRKEKNCKNFSVWGISDAENYVGFPVLFDENFKKKKAYNTVLGAFKN